MIKEWTNSILMTLLWSFISVVVPLSAFWFFVKVQEKELTVAIAFTVRYFSSRGAYEAYLMGWCYYTGTLPLHHGSRAPQPVCHTSQDAFNPS